MFRLFFSLIALALISTSPAVAARPDMHHVDTSAIFIQTLTKAKAGDAASQYLIGLRFETGQDVKQSFPESNQWFQKAAAQGLSMAELKLGDHYQFGKGMPVNLVEAVKWYSQAAAQDNYVAQHALGKLYLSGDGVKQDFVEGYFWLSLAALEKQYAVDRDRSANLLKPDQIAAVKARVDKWRKDRAEQAKQEKKG